MRAEKETAAKVKKEHGSKRQHPNSVSGEDGDEDEDEDEVPVTSIVTPSMKRARIARTSGAGVIDLTDD